MNKHVLFAQTTTFKEEVTNKIKVSPHGVKSFVQIDKNLPISYYLGLNKVHKIVNFCIENIRFVI